MDAQQVQNLIQAGIPDAKVTVSGGEGKFEIRDYIDKKCTLLPKEISTTDAFPEGLMPVKRHQLVYATVREQIADGSLHALTIRPLTPEESEKTG